MNEESNANNHAVMEPNQEIMPDVTCFVLFCLTFTHTNSCRKTRFCIILRKYNKLTCFVCCVFFKITVNTTPKQPAVISRKKNKTNKKRSYGRMQKEKDSSDEPINGLSIYFCLL